MTDQEILTLYSTWSEEYHCAGFLNPSSETVKDFRDWLNRHSEPLKDYEQEMLEEFHKQEQEEKEA